jgi:hypothetical protein
LGDDINAVVYLSLRTAGVRGVSFDSKWQVEGVGEPQSFSRRSDIPKEWRNAVTRFCMPAYMIDPNGSDQPLTLRLFIDEHEIQQFTLHVSQGLVTGQTKCGPPVTT